LGIDVAMLFTHILFLFTAVIVLIFIILVWSTHLPKNIKNWISFLIIILTIVTFLTLRNLWVKSISSLHETCSVCI
jgi:hypothetical protein